MYQNIKCPNCKSRTKAILQQNRWVKWIIAECYVCGWQKLIPEKEFDFIQPESPFFKIIYGYDPIAEESLKQKLLKSKKENDKQSKEDNLRRRGLKPWQIKDIKSYIRNRGLE
jgi:hypothetical protein